MIGLLKNVAFSGGAWVIYILAGCSVLSIAIMIERGVVLFREKKYLLKVRGIFARIAEGESPDKLLEGISPIEGLSARVLSSGLFHISRGPDSVGESINSSLFSEKQRLEKRMIVLGTLGNNAVYIGLFGTVLGVIKAFHDLAEQGSAGPEVVMQGLSEALIATAVGLLVALPCVIAYNIFQKQIKDVLVETESMSSMLLSQLRSEEKKK